MKPRTAKETAVICAAIVVAIAIVAPVDNGRWVVGVASAGVAGLGITAQEHTDLKLGEVSAQLDHLREQMTSLQKILKDVE
jgi:hypothetical protein